MRFLYQEGPKRSGRKVVTTREYDEQGRLVRETTTTEEPRRGFDDYHRWPDPDGSEGWPYKYKHGGWPVLS